MQHTGILHKYSFNNLYIFTNKYNLNNVFLQNFSRNYADSNPGGSGDPNDYYHPSMTRDPWQNLRPVSVTNKGPTTT